MDGVLRGIVGGGAVEGKRSKERRLWPKMMRILYEWMLRRQISRDEVPGSIAVVLSSGDLDGAGIDILRAFIGWLKTLGVKCVLLYVADQGPDLERRISDELVGAGADITIHTKDGARRLGLEGDLKLIISLDYGGKREVTEAITAILNEVEQGIVEPEEIDEEMIEAKLRFDQRPELVIRAGGKQLSDFMIWQAAYSELYFTEVNWKSMRKIDLLRAVRDYQTRERRFGG